MYWNWERKNNFQPEQKALISERALKTHSTLPTQHHTSDRHGERLADEHSAALTAQEFVQRPKALLQRGTIVSTVIRWTET